MKKRRRFSISKFLLFLLLLIIVLFLILLAAYKIETSPVSSNTDSKTITVEKGDNYFTLASKLKAKKLIKSEMFYKLYLKFSKPASLVDGDYELNEAMSTAEIIKVLSDKSSQNNSIVKITFREGLNIRQMAKIVENKTGISQSDFINKISDVSYLKTLQQDYWFLTDDIYNSQIYYPLEGYLFPDTYHFEKSELNIDSIVRKILDNTLVKLKPYKIELQSGTYTIHQKLTIASLLELEASTDDDRALVASVFYNRLTKNWSLGSDVTTYYASKKSLTEALTKSDLNACNGYNTRCLTMKGLPVGPIDNPSISSIKAAIYPASSDYYYFVADTSKKVYFSKTATEQATTIAKLKKAGKWTE